MLCGTNVYTVLPQRVTVFHTFFFYFPHFVLLAFFLFRFSKLCMSLYSMKLCLYYYFWTLRKFIIYNYNYSLQKNYVTGNMLMSKKLERNIIRSTDFRVKNEVEFWTPRNWVQHFSKQSVLMNGKLKRLEKKIETMQWSYVATSEQGSEALLLFSFLLKFHPRPLDGEPSVVRLQGRDNPNRMYYSMDIQRTFIHQVYFYIEYFSLGEHCCMENYTNIHNTYWKYVLKKKLFK